MIDLKVVLIPISYNDDSYMGDKFRFIYLYYFFCFRTIPRVKNIEFKIIFKKKYIYIGISFFSFYPYKYN